MSRPGQDCMRELGQSHKLNGENLPASSASSLPSDKSEKVVKSSSNNTEMEAFLL